MKGAINLNDKDKALTVLDTDVLVIGAGPVGLALAGDLGWRGVKCLIIDKGDGSIYQPRMDLVGARTMEFCRRWGIVPWVEACPYPRNRPQDNIYVTSLNGYELGRAPSPSMAAIRPPKQSPQHRYRSPQNMFDPILVRHAKQYPSVTLKHNVEFLDVVSQSESVLVEARDTESGNPIQIQAKFVVGCDGGSSRVREILGIDVGGARLLTTTTNVIFKCSNLDQLHDKSDGYRWIFIGPKGTWATLVAINGVDQWRFSIVDTKERIPSDDEIRDAILQAAGFNFDFEILSVMHWKRREFVAESYHKGRIFIAGDAAHTTSPTGGFGMNTGIGDAVDLAWKLDAVLSGWGGETLFDSYDIERHPVAIRNFTEASRNLERMTRPCRELPPKEIFEPGLEGDKARESFGKYFGELMSNEWDTLGIHLGYCYDNSPICVRESDEPVFIDDYTNNFKQSALPGMRAPHVWLSDGQSTLDWFGRGFVLVILDNDPNLGASIVEAANEMGIPLTTQSTDLKECQEAYGKKLVLVRPDGHVAWRSNVPPSKSDALNLLKVVTGR